MAHRTLNRFTHDTFKYQSIAVQTLECEGRHQGMTILSSRHVFSVDAVCRFQTKHKGPKLVAFIHSINFLPGEGGGGCSPLYKTCKYAPPQRVWFWGLFGLKTGIHFANFGLVSGMVFEGLTRLYERISCFNSKWIRTKWKYANPNYICGIFCLHSNLSIYDDIISAKRPSLKNG